MLGVVLYQNSKISHLRAELEGVKPEVEVVIKHDTITRFKPVEIEREVVRRDTLYLTNIEEVHDTVMVPIPIEVKIYKEDSLYRAVVSGYKPSLDSISVFPKTVYETKVYTVKEKKKLTFGLNLGAGCVLPYREEPKLGAYMGVGLTYNF